MSDNNFDENAYREVFNSSAESILVVDQLGKIIMANPRSEELFEFESGSLVGNNVGDLIPEKFRTGHKKHLKKYNQDPKPRQMGKGRDLVGRTKSGKQFPIEVSLNPAMLKGQRVVIAFLIDITKRKGIEDALASSEKQLIKYASELERRVDDRTQELKKAVYKLEETNDQLGNEISDRIKAEDEARKSLEREKELNELKSRFVSMASHEFRTPLSTILSSASLISKYTQAEQEEKRIKHVERIKSNVHDLTGILNDFLSLDKLEQGRIQNNPKEIELVSYLSEVIEELSLITKEGQEMIFFSNESSCLMNIDPQILKHIMSNLLSNAVKYSGEGDRIEVNFGIDKNKIRIEVRDQGVGIPQNEAKHLFERFFRAHNVSHIQGTGLGLNLVKKYLDLLDGNIDYKPNNDRGSTFVVLLNKNTK